MTETIARSIPVHKFPYQCGAEPDCHVISRNLLPGKYFLELWGAEGGGQDKGLGGKGGYAFGFFKIYKTEKIYMNIGAKGTCTSNFDQKTTPSFNGGGIGKMTSQQYVKQGSFACSGGGATDIRLSSNDAQHRIIVAGGGGGGSLHLSDIPIYSSGGSGGGLNGFGSSIGLGCSIGGGGNQTSGGFSKFEKGTFGYGGNVSSGDGCGGGGGWFGGGAGYTCISGGGGGSGFVFSKQSIDTIDKLLIPIPKMYFLTGSGTEDGNHRFKGFTDLYDDGHAGNGAIRITFISSVSFISKISSFFHCVFLSAIPLISL